MQLSIGKYHLPNKVTNAEELLFRIFLTKVYYLRIIRKYGLLIPAHNRKISI